MSINTQVNLGVFDDDVLIEEWRADKEDNTFGWRKEKKPEVFFETYQLNFRVPVDYTKRSGGDLVLRFKLVTKKKEKEVSKNTTFTPGSTEKDLKTELGMRRILLFLCGGPGAANQPGRIPDLNVHFLNSGYWILFPDYRGNGDSSKDLIRKDSWLEENFKYLRQTDIVRDLESVRIRLLGDNKWTTFGQSYGGWVTMSYLSYYPRGLERCYITSGIPPIGAPIEKHFENIYARIIQKNEDYYKTNPNHKRIVKDIVHHLLKLEMKGKHQRLLDGSFLTAKRFLAIGRSAWGKAASQEDLAKLVVIMNEEIGNFSDEVLRKFFDLDGSRFGERPLAALLYEAMFVPEQVKDTSAARLSSEWTAYSLTRTHPKISKHFWWTSENLESFAARLEKEDALYFCGEMVYPCWFEAYSGLRRYQDNNLVKKIQTHIWTEPLYDLHQLRNNQVKVTAIVPRGDVYVDFELSKKASENIANLKFVVKDNWEHGELNYRTQNVIEELFPLQTPLISL